MLASASADKLLAGSLFPQPPNSKPPLLQKNYEQINFARERGEYRATGHLLAGGNECPRVENFKADRRCASPSMRNSVELRALLFHRDVFFPEPASVSHLLALLVGVQGSTIGPARGNQN